MEIVFSLFRQRQHHPVGVRGKSISFLPPSTSSLSVPPVFPSFPRLTNYKLFSSLIWMCGGDTTSIGARVADGQKMGKRRNLLDQDTRKRKRELKLNWTESESTGCFRVRGYFDTPLNSWQDGPILTPFEVVNKHTLRFVLRYNDAWYMARWLQDRRRIDKT